MNQLNESQNRVSQQLHTLTSCSWQEQIQVIKSLKITPQLIKLINHRNYSSELATLFASHNPRTKLITVLTDFLLELFASYSNQLVSFANLLISNECLIRLLGSGNKVISSSVNQIMKCIISNIDFKNKGKSIKFVSSLQQEFLNSKNTYVREKISLYFLLISTSFYYSSRESLGDFERKVVKQGLQDASEKVRANMKQILENIHHFEKQNDFASQQKALNRKSTDKVSLKSTKISKYAPQNKSSRVLNNSSINQSSIIQNFTEPNKLKPEPESQIKEESYSFYLERLRNGNSWAMILIAYESLTSLIKRGYLIHEANDSLYCQTIKVLTPFLNQKRCKLYQSCVQIYNSLLQLAKEKRREKIIAFCQENAYQIIQNVVKNEYAATKLLPTIISLNPSFFIAKISEISVNVKIYRQKFLLLDSIVLNLQMILQEPLTGKSNKKIASMMKAMCLHIQNSTLKEKEISLAALAVISQLKSRYAEEVLTALLCQTDKSLTKILELAQSIDPSLKIAIIDYINSLKASSKKSSSTIQKQLTLDRKVINQLIDKQIILISQQKTPNLNKLGQIMFTHMAELECNQFRKVLLLLEFLCNADLIMQYKILMEEICRQSNKQFLNAIVQVITIESSPQNTKQRQFHDILLLEILEIRVNQTTSSNIDDISKITKCLIQVYRTSQSLKKRNKAIDLLTKMKAQQLQQELNENERLLIETYRQSLNEEEDILTL